MKVPGWSVSSPDVLVSILIRAVATLIDVVSTPNKVQYDGLRQNFYDRCKNIELNQLTTSGSSEFSLLSKRDKKEQLWHGGINKILLVPSTLQKHNAAILSICGSNFIYFTGIIRKFSAHMWTNFDNKMWNQHSSSCMCCRNVLSIDLRLVGYQLCVWITQWCGLPGFPSNWSIWK